MGNGNGERLQHRRPENRNNSVTALKAFVGWLTRTPAANVPDAARK